MDKPRPVPPNLRLVEPSTYLKASKTISSLLCGIPIPWSLTENKMHSLGLFIIPGGRLFGLDI
jgi:hypothetical protein